MAEHHMSAREAWEIVTSAVNLGGFVSEAHKARYARACAIVEALVRVWEAQCAFHGEGRVTGSVATEWLEAQKAVRALERGDAAQAAKEGR